ADVEFFRPHHGEGAGARAGDKEPAVLARKNAEMGNEGIRLRRHRGERVRHGDKFLAPGRLHQPRNGEARMQLRERHRVAAEAGEGLARRAENLAHHRLERDRRIGRAAGPLRQHPPVAVIEADPAVAAAAVGREIHGLVIRGCHPAAPFRSTLVEGKSYPFCFNLKFETPCTAYSMVAQNKPQWQECGKIAMRTQVAIIGSGPAGLLLGQLLHRQGVDTVILDRASPDYILGRIRAGVIEQGFAALMAEAGVADRLAAEGERHDTVEISVDGVYHPIRLAELTGGRHVTVYGQTEITRDLLAARAAAGLPGFYGAENVTPHDMATDKPYVTFQ